MRTLILVAAVLVAAWLARARRAGIRRHGQKLPCVPLGSYHLHHRPPNTLPILGNGIWFLQARHKLLDWFTRCERRFGFETFEISVPSLPPGVVINDPKNLEYVLKHDELFIKGEFFKTRSWDLFGNGIINSDGPLWRVQRKAGLRFFSNANLKTLADVYLPSFFAETKSYLDQRARENGVVDLENVLLEFTTRVMGRLAYDITGSLINSLIDEIEDPEVVADAALNFLSAGRDTTAQSLTWSFYMLMRNPNVVDRLREELDGIFGPGREMKLSFDEIQPTSLPYAMAVFYETLRLFPPVPFELKQCTSPTTLPDGTLLPRGAVVTWCPWAMGRSARIWHDEPDSFRPERWLEEGHDGARQFKTRTQYDFPVFNGGPRLCLGKKMAELQAVFVVAGLVREYDFEEVVVDKDGAGRPTERRSRNSLTLPMEGGLPCVVKRVIRSD
ncbi:MAG: hypothetical protein M1832_004820 [Thelocarpon impressellum]|nr:MAG: hypothetical protein M1832_004820 [Thelocarpon impressellum]